MGAAKSVEADKFEGTAEYVMHEGEYDETTTDPPLQTPEEIAAQPGVLDLISEFEGCCIPATEERAIKVRQLFWVWGELCRRCTKEAWIGRRRKPDSTRTRLKLKPDIVNLYDLALYLIRPATLKKRCSFVEVVARAPQAPLWFVSHAWGESVNSFLSCVCQHAQDRDLSHEVPYWVCAYANNQWDLAAEIATSPEDTSFFKAMKMAARNGGGTVSVFGTSENCWSRIWCCYEVATSVRSNSGLKYDFYAVAATNYSKPVEGLQTAVGICDGEAPGRDIVAFSKSEKEQYFPSKLLLDGLRVSLECGQASVEADRVRILNSIAGRSVSDLDLPPFSEHPKYDAVNESLHGLCAAALLPSSLCARDDEVRARVLSSLKNATILRIQVVLAHWAPEYLPKLLAALPPTLLELEILEVLFASNLGTSLQHCSNLISLKVTNCPMLHRLPTLPPSLRRLEVYGCCGLRQDEYEKAGLELVWS